MSIVTVSSSPYPIAQASDLMPTQPRSYPAGRLPNGGTSAEFPPLEAVKKSTLPPPQPQDDGSSALFNPATNIFNTQTVPLGNTAGAGTLDVRFTNGGLLTQPREAGASQNVLPRGLNPVGIEAKVPVYRDASGNVELNAKFALQAPGRGSQSVAAGLELSGKIDRVKLNASITESQPLSSVFSEGGARTTVAASIAAPLGNVTVEAEVSRTTGAGQPGTTSFKPSLTANIDQTQVKAAFPMNFGEKGLDQIGVVFSAKPLDARSDGAFGFIKADYKPLGEELSVSVGGGVNF